MRPHRGQLSLRAISSNSLQFASDMQDNIKSIGVVQCSVMRDGIHITLLRPSSVSIPHWESKVPEPLSLGPDRILPHIRDQNMEVCVPPVPSLVNSSQFQPTRPSLSLNLSLFLSGVALAFYSTLSFLCVSLSSLFLPCPCCKVLFTPLCLESSGTYRVSLSGELGYVPCCRQDLLASLSPAVLRLLLLEFVITS